MPDMTPIGNTVVPPNPNQSINTLSGILGIQQQQVGLAQARQNLQTGQYTQQTAQAESQQAQQKNQELQKAQAIIVHGAQNGTYDDGQGGLDRVKASRDISAIGPYAQSMSGQLLSQANEIVSNRQALFNMDTSKRKVVGDKLGALAADGDIDHTKIISGMTDLASDYPNDKDLNRLTHSMVAAIPPNAQGPQLQQILNNAAAAAKGEPGVEPATNAANQLVNRAKYSGQLSPAGQVGTAGGKGPGLNPSSPAVAAATTTASGTAQDDNKRNDEISRSVQPSRGAITLADQVANLADQVHTGKFSKEVTDFAATIGQDNPTIAARQLISKYAAQLRTVASANAPTDTSREQIYAGFPDPEHMSPEAIKGASEYIKGSMLMNLSRAANARQFTQTHGSTQGLRVADDQFSQNADPLMYTYQNLPKGAARQDFIKRHFSSAQDAGDFVRRKNAVEHYGGFQQ